MSLLSQPSIDLKIFGSLNSYLMWVRSEKGCELKDGKKLNQIE